MNSWQFLSHVVANSKCRLGAAQTPLIGDGVDFICRPGLFSRLICGGTARTEPNKGHTNPEVSGFTENSSVQFLSWQMLTFSRLCPNGVGGFVPSGRLPGLQVAGLVSVFECHKTVLQTGTFTIRGDGTEMVEGRGVTAGGGPRNDAWLFLLSIEHTGNVHNEFVFGHQRTHYWNNIFKITMHILMHSPIL